MEEYVVSARKYRPMSFTDVVGQGALTATLKNMVQSGKLAHAYLFCGPRGVGKTTCARIFAKAINCTHLTNEGEACNECESCSAFNEGRSLNIFELDAASNNSVNDIRELILQTRVPPQSGRYKVFIIDEVHMLSAAAFNAFLKTLEEPPAHVVFILATTEKQKILPTILSRCQIFDFDRMTVRNTIEHLKKVAESEQITYDEQALALIAEKADGGMRDALSIFDQAASFCKGHITYDRVLEDLNVLDADYYFKLVELAYETKAADMMMMLNGLLNKGFDGGRIVNGLAAHLRNVLMAKDEVTLPLIEVGEQMRQRYAEQAKKCSAKFIFKALQLANRCDIHYRESSNKRLLVELTLIEVAQIMQPDEDSGVGRSPKRLKTLFEKASSLKPTSQVVGESRQKTQRAASEVRTSEAPTATTATPAAAATGRPANKVKLAGMGMTFGAILRKAKEQPTEQTIEVENKGEANHFDDELLAVEWLAMCQRMPKEMRGMAQRMMHITPHITHFPQIEVVADNEILLHQMEHIRARILATLAKQLHHAGIELKFRLAEPTEVKKILTKRELFDKMRSENHAVELLRTALRLELS